MAAKVSLGFAKFSDVELDNFAQGVIDRMTGNATYPTPPVTLANLQTAKDDFTTRIAAAQAGGPADTAAKNNSRQSLLGMLRQVGNYVQILDLELRWLIVCVFRLTPVVEVLCGKLHKTSSPENCMNHVLA